MKAMLETQHLFPLTCCLSVLSIYLEYTNVVLCSVSPLTKGHLRFGVSERCFGMISIIDTLHIILTFRFDCCFFGLVRCPVIQIILPMFVSPASHQKQTAVYMDYKREDILTTKSVYFMAKCDSNVEKHRFENA